MPRNWRKQAACTALPDPDRWFPDGKTGHHLLRAEEAKRVCRTQCPVMETCAAWAHATRQEYGIYGGVDEDERRSDIRRERRSRTRQIGSPRNDLDGRRPQMAREAYARREAGQSVNAIATDLGLGWHLVSALIDEGRAAA